MWAPPSRRRLGIRGSYAVSSESKRPQGFVKSLRIDPHVNKLPVQVKHAPFESGKVQNFPRGVCHEILKDGIQRCKPFSYGEVLESLTS